MKTDTPQKKRGRPSGYRAENPMDKPLPKVMATRGQLAAYKAAAEREGVTFSAWVRDTLDKEAQK